MVSANSVWFVAPLNVEVRAVAIPPIEDGQVLVRTSFSGISTGTELLAYRGQLDPDLPVDETIGALGGTFRYPFRYGYSCVGVVESSRADELPDGTTVFAFHPHQDVFVADACDVVVLEGVAPRQATLFPLVETALQISLDAGPVLGETVCVFGLGVIGALTSLVLRRAGAHVFAVDPLSWRREAIAGLDVETVAPEELSAALATGDSIGSVPLIVEASGNPDVLRSALGLLAHEGTALVASWYGNKDVALPLGREFHRRRLTIRSSQVSTIPAHLSGRWTYDRRRRAVVELLGSLPLDRFATHTFQFARASEAFAALDGRAEGVIHVALGYE
jgi:2-desacetyl-2-hydroxyethyl bacteriochlorophyllide A dehydrogenase